MSSNILNIDNTELNVIEKLKLLNRDSKNIPVFAPLSVYMINSILFEI